MSMTYTGLGIKQAVVRNERAQQQEKVGNSEPEDHSHHAD